MKIITIVRFGVAALAMGAFFGVGLPVRADQLVWVRAQPLNYFKVRGLDNTVTFEVKVAK